MSVLFEESKKIYNRLADLESKEIFASRIQYSLTEDYQYIKQLVSISQKGFSEGAYDRGEAVVLLNKLKSELQDKKIIIYGAGYVGREIANLLKTLHIHGFCDKNCAKLPNIVDGIKVYSLEEATRMKEVVFLIGSWRYRESMRESLLSYGVSERNMINFPSNCMINVSDEQYFEKELIFLDEDEVFVDCGGYHFETSIEFLRQTNGKYKKIFAFEPDKMNYQRMIDYIEEAKLEDVYCECAGVWKENGNLSFQSDMDSSMITEKGTDTIRVISLDEELLDEHVTFIKMDVEGAELDALRGASKIISNYKPKLAISIYHKPEDIIELPTYILDLNPEYQLYLRHYSNSDVETVMYAI